MSGRLAITFSAKSITLQRELAKTEPAKTATSEQ